MSTEQPRPPDREGLFTKMDGAGSMIVGILAFCGVLLSAGAADQRLRQLEKFQTDHIAETKEARSSRDARDQRIEDSVAVLKDAHGTRLTKLEDSFEQIHGLLVDIKKQLDEQDDKRSR